MKLDYVKVPFTNNPSMTRFEGPIYNKNPDKRYLIDKEKQFNFLKTVFMVRRPYQKKTTYLKIISIF